MVKLTLKDDSPTYSQNLPTPINLKDDTLVNLKSLHKYGITTTLPFPKYTRPIFAQTKPSGKIRLSVDLNLDDYTNGNHPLKTST